MSNEIQVTANLECTNGSFNIRLGQPHSVDQNNAGGKPGGAPGYVVVGLTEVDVDLSSFTKPGYLYIRNLGYLGTGTNADPIITHGPNSGGNLIPYGDLKVGEEAVMRLTGQYTPTLTLLSTEEESAVQLTILED